jgi:hypothetical protein
MASVSVSELRRRAEADDRLYEKYAKSLEDKHKGEFVAISRDGQVIWGKDDVAVLREAIELSPKREHTFTLADGSTVVRRISECYIILPQGEAHTPVILGENDDEALLGVVTLEILGLVFDPFKRTLKPMRMLLV